MVFTTAAPGTLSPLCLSLPGAPGYPERGCFSPAQGPIEEPLIPLTFRQDVFIGASGCQVEDPFPLRPYLSTS